MSDFWKVVHSNWLLITLLLKRNKPKKQKKMFFMYSYDVLTNSDLNYEFSKMHGLSLEQLSGEVNNNINTTTSNHNQHKPWH